MSPTLTLAPDAAMALGIAATAMPFARTPTEQAERWLRVLRMHGEVGVTLQALGVSEGSLGAPGGGAEREPRGQGDPERANRGDAEGPCVDSGRAARANDSGRAARANDPGQAPRANDGEQAARANVERPDVVGVEDGEAIARVTEGAVRIAGRRGAAGVATSDLLIAVMDVYGADFDRVLQAHGTDRDAVLERLGAKMD